MKVEFRGKYLTKDWDQSDLKNVLCYPDHLQYSGMANPSSSEIFFWITSFPSICKLSNTLRLTLKFSLT